MNKQARVERNVLRRSKRSACCCYLVEESLVAELFVSLQTERPLVSCDSWQVEVRHATGVVDMVGLKTDGKVVTFEAKLKNWRKALHQAYRNTAFAHFSYVVLPIDTAELAANFRAEFEAMGVGLIQLGGPTAGIRIRPRAMQPILPWITEQLKAAVMGTDER